MEPQGEQSPGEEEEWLPWEGSGRPSYMKIVPLHNTTEHALLDVPVPLPDCHSCLGLIGGEGGGGGEEGREEGRKGEGREGRGEGRGRGKVEGGGR